MSSDIRNLRHGATAALSELARSSQDDLPSPDVYVLTTVADPLGATYPVAARVSYPVKAQRVSGVEIAGNPVTLTAIGDAFYAANLGDGIPPLGTEGIIGKLIGGLIVFTYNS
jgi:hypothetical protein